MQPVALGRPRAGGSRRAHGSEGFDGVVVVHGTDTMAYSASALALLLGPLPAARSCSPARSGRSPRSGPTRGRTWSTPSSPRPCRCPEVGIAFASRVLRGARAMKRDAWALGRVRFSQLRAARRARNRRRRSRSHVRAPAAALAPFDPRLEPRVLAVRVFPGLDPALVRGAVRCGRARAWSSRRTARATCPTSPGSLIPALEEARERGVPVLVVSQCPRGFVDMRRYAGGAAAAAAGAISGGDMTVEAALAKMMIGLGAVRHGSRAARVARTRRRRRASPAMMSGSLALEPLGPVRFCIHAITPSIDVRAAQQLQLLLALAPERVLHRAPARVHRALDGRVRERRPGLDDPRHLQRRRRAAPPARRPSPRRRAPAARRPRPSRRAAPSASPWPCPRGAGSQNVPPPSGIRPIFTNFSCTYARVDATRRSHAKRQVGPEAHGGAVDHRDRRLVAPDDGS